MTSDIRLAFEHPEARAQAGGQPSQPLDRISLRDHIVEVEIGAFQAERGTTQRVSFNIVVEVEPPTGPIEDDVDKILSYDTISEAIAHELAAQRLNLLETLAERIAERILIAPQAVRVFVRIEKLDRGPGALGVEIMRRRGQGKPAIRQAEDLPHPLVVHLSNTAIHDAKLGAFLDRVAKGTQPAILCVGAADVAPVTSDHPMTQRRIDLLAIEQNAWVLAAQDRRCVVVETRTELDWAMKHGQISVWAPSKITLDAIDGPNANPRDAAMMTAWFAKQVQAAEILYIGEKAPPSDVPARMIGLEDAF
ncbi:MAG: dihydroneopterin aldolase [Maritimibacter sp.]